MIDFSPGSLGRKEKTIDAVEGWNVTVFEHNWLEATNFENFWNKMIRLLILVQLNTMIDKCEK